MGGERADREEAWILPIGLEYDRVIECLAQGGRVFHLVHGEPVDDSYVNREAARFAEEVYDYLSRGPYEVHEPVGVDVLDLNEVSKVLKKIIKDELERNRDININVASSSKIVSLASLYVASMHPDRVQLFYPKTDNYLILDIMATVEKLVEDELPQDEAIGELRNVYEQYQEHGWSSSFSETLEIPVVPFRDLSKTQSAVLLELYSREDHAFESLSALTEAIHANPEYGVDWKDGKAGRSSVTYAVNELLEVDLVEKTSGGREKRIKIRPSGELYVEVFLQ